MTSEEYVDSLRDNGVMLVKTDGSLMEIPSDFLELAAEECRILRAGSIAYEIFDPHDSDHTELKVWDCGYAE